MTKAARLAAELNVEQKEKIQQMFMDAVDKAGGETTRNWIVIIRVKKKRKEEVFGQGNSGYNTR